MVKGQMKETDVSRERTARCAAGVDSAEIRKLLDDAPEVGQPTVPVDARRLGAGDQGHGVALDLSAFERERNRPQSGVGSAAVEDELARGRRIDTILDLCPDDG